MAFSTDVVTVELPDTVRLVPFEELRTILKTDDPRYPTRVALYCDECEVIVGVEVIVTDAVSGPEWLAMGRAYLRTKNWQSDTSGDFCPDHKKKPENPFKGDLTFTGNEP